MGSIAKDVSVNVLLADDEAYDRFLFGKALKEIPVTTNLITIEDGEKLMQHLNENSGRLPNIIFLDISMPGQTGVECLSEIKGNEKLKHIPVVMFTIAFPKDKHFEMTLKNTLTDIGASGFITKTSDFTALKEAISNALKLAFP